MDSKILVLLGFLQITTCEDPFHYVVHGDAVNFNLAKKNCQREGNLTTLSTNKEILEVKQTISEHVSSTGGDYTFWIGLWRPKAECLIPDRKLKGFRWINGDMDAEDLVWKTAPEPTCTHERCVYISITYDGTSIQHWGLVEDTCSKQHPFICKVKGEKATKQCKSPTITATHDSEYSQGSPAKVKVMCGNSNTFVLICNAETLEWTTTEGKAVDFTGMCLPCLEGYEKYNSGHCVDIDECKKQPCGSEKTCVNTAGSFYCKGFPTKLPALTLATADQPLPVQTNTESPSVTTALGTTNNMDNKHLVDGTPTSPDYSKIYIPIICAVLALLLLLVIILAIVACCRRKKRRRSKDLANNKNAKQSMALRDSMDRINEK